MLLWFGHGCSGYRMLLEHERYYGLGMDALVIVCSWNTNVIMVWAGMLGLSCALGTRTVLWLGHGCTRYRMLLEHERYYGLGMDVRVIVCSWNTNVIMVWAWMLWLSYALGTRTLLWLGHGCSSPRILLEHERYYGLRMDALVTVISHRILLEHERYYGLGTDALVSVCSSFSGSCPQLSAVRPPLQPSWLASPAPWPTPRGLSPPSASTNLRTPWQKSCF